MAPEPAATAAAGSVGSAASTPSAYILDGHNDLPWTMRELCGYDLDRIDLTGSVPKIQTDLPRLRRGGVGAQFWSVFVPCGLSGGAAVTATLEQIDFVKTMVAKYPDTFALATTATEVEEAVAGGRIASLMGMEGGHSIDESLPTLRMMHELGVRYMTLTHNENVSWADSATDEPVLGGLSDFGRRVVEEMNRIGMFVDLSHVSADTMRDALSVTRAPVIFSHSGARAACDINRNVPDDVLAKLPANGGVCMVAFVAMFVAQQWADWYADTLDLVEAGGGDRRRFSDIDPVLQRRVADDPPAACTVAQLADHVDHVRAVAGVEHVGLGGDYDGASVFPEGMGDVAGYPVLLDELRRRGWSEAELALLGHGNLLRAMRAMEDTRG